MGAEENWVLGWVGQWGEALLVEAVVWQEKATAPARGSAWAVV